MVSNTDRAQNIVARMLKRLVTLIGLTQVVPETGFLRESVGAGEVFSLKNPVSLAGWLSPD
jgi:hypothetical protein